MQRVLQIAFHQTFGPNVRAKALETCADVIRGNPALQEQFGDLSVPAVKQSAPAVNGRATPKGTSVKSGASTPANVEMSNVIESLLELTLDSSATPYFEVRLAACNCVKAFFEAHNGIRGHVLRRAIEGHRSGDDAVPNILTVLLEPPNTRSNQDPYQQWMAALLLMHLLIDNSESKDAALKVSDTEHDTDGDEEYENVTFVQSITSNVVAGVQHPEDERALIGYLMLLSTWLFEDLSAVNDLLGEGSTIQGLISAVKVASPTMPLVAGMCTFLLGIIYEFSTKDSPIPRATLHSVLQKNLTREVFVDRLTKLRESPFIRDFEVLPTATDAGLPEVFFDQTFVDFFKDNFSRFLRSIDREPGFEVSILTNGVQKGVSRELVDSLRAEMEESRVSLEAAQAEVATIRQKLDQELLEHKRTKDTTGIELGRIRQINQSLQNNHEEELSAMQAELTRQTTSLTAARDTAVSQLRQDHSAALEQLGRQHKAEKEYLEQRRAALEKEVTRQKEAVAKHQSEAEKMATQSRHIQKEQQTEIDSLHKTLKSFEEQLSKAKQEHESQLQQVRSELEKALQAAQNKSSEAENELSETRELLEATRNESVDLQTKLSSAEKRAKDAEGSLKSAQADSKTSRDKADTAQTEKTALQSELQALKKELEALKKSKAAEKNNGPSAKETEELKAAAAKQKDTQTELDDLLVVFADLEAKREADKKRLKDLGEEVSEDEDEGEEGDEEEEEEE